MILVYDSLKRHIKYVRVVDIFFWMVLLFWWNSRLNLKFHLLRTYFFLFFMLTSLFSCFRFEKELCHFVFRHTHTHTQTMKKTNWWKWFRLLFTPQHTRIQKRKEVILSFFLIMVSLNVCIFPFNLFYFRYAKRVSFVSVWRQIKMLLWLNL